MASFLSPITLVHAGIANPGEVTSQEAPSPPSPDLSPSATPSPSPESEPTETEPTETELQTPASALPEPSNEPAPSPSPAPDSSPLSENAPPLASSEPQPAANDHQNAFPSLNVYLPEGEFDIRLRKLIRNVLFEGQVNYNFVNGDISTFLRYKYYARAFTYKIGLFDSLSFKSLQDTSGDFNRVRGAFVQFEHPRKYNRRLYFLTEDDRFLHGDVDNPDNRKSNLFVKLGYQIGSPFDERLNSIASESSGRVPPVLTAFRELGPRKFAAAVGITEGIPSAGDFNYTRLEAEALKRFDVSSSTFLIMRGHLGSMLQKSPSGLTRADFPPDESSFDLPSWAYRVPFDEYFRLGGRDALKGVDDHKRGTDEAHLTGEYFVPLFRNRDFKTWVIHWNNLYGTGYVGAGTLGFRGKPSDQFTDYKLGDLTADAGLGVESSVTVRDFTVYLTAVFASTVQAPDALRHNEFRFSVRTTRY
ncbi:MAG: hypothetical protein ABI718_05135 [Acidobacteriota bacterium]